MKRDKLTDAQLRTLREIGDIGGVHVPKWVNLGSLDVRSISPLRRGKFIETRVTGNWQSQVRITSRGIDKLEQHTPPPTASG